MTRGHHVSKAAILLARRIAGKEREEWVRAMAGEWDALDRGKTRWALGCLAAAVTDRLGREWRFLAAMLAAVPAAFICNGVLMTLVAPALRESGAPTIVWMAAYLLNPVAIPLALGALYPSRAGWVAILTAAAFLFMPMVASVVFTGVSPFEWIAMVGRRMGAAAVMYPLAFGAWYAAGRLGARMARLRRLPA